MKSYLPSNTIFIVYICLFLFVSCAGFFRKKIPNSPLNDPRKMILVRIDPGRLGEFKEKTEGKYNISYQESDSYYSVINKQDIDKFGFPSPGISVVKQYLPFKYYSGNYQELINERFTSLEDLKKGYKDNILNIHYLLGIANLYSEQSRMEVIGKTARGREIPALLLTNTTTPDEEKISVLFNCAHHANEVISIEHCYDIIYSVLSRPKEYQEILNKMKIWIVPIVNPDGARHFWHVSNLMGRKNGYPGSGPVNDKLNPGVDINRNYPFYWGKAGGGYSSSNPSNYFYRGPSPGSESETKAMMDLANRERFAASISYHAYANCLLIPYSIDSLNNPEPDVAKEIGKKIAASVTSLNPEKEFEAKKNIYPIDGVDQDYFYFAHGTLAYLLETTHLNPEYKEVEKVNVSLRKAWNLLLNEVLEGKKIFLKITDEFGTPLEAKVEIERIKYFQEEIRVSNPINGFFFQLFPDRKETKVKISKEGYEPTEIQTRPNGKWEPLKIVLKKNRI
ncbi:Zinc carboxypeptidase [Leptospira interrogans serovar Manilae]|uniref:Zinc carboxypeptidase n=1 Tax=Leptospira interrogans serovar Manilae TaxID=214675 RepID=A0AAQ1SQ05_LEPIR|nr:M14 family zinc carboxypeptidase [Leptospira interrogans]AKP25314.1 peptidase M14 [Leptospira interrogans serovar Manilae]AKP29099.1 peptidase M14 [Leptospira interrogans serovar Manilae]EYU62434.1 peptidase M14 [Leptospira interrogans serovar Manilae]SOR62812.1 Zinc carboxypeptidase [Leptospira interrogans serovar Manilae]